MYLQRKQHKGPSKDWIMAHLYKGILWRYKQRENTIYQHRKSNEKSQNTYYMSPFSLNAYYAYVWKRVYKDFQQRPSVE